MAWITLQEDYLEERLALAEIQALRTAATGEAGNPVPEVLANVVQEVRGRVAANPKNKLGEGDTIPSELRATALAVARWRVLSRLPGIRMLQDDARRLEYTDALRLLEDVAAGKFAIAQPDEETDEMVGGVAPPVTGEPRNKFKPVDGA